MKKQKKRALVFVDGKLVDDKTSSEVLCDRKLVDDAALKETSLFDLANKCHIDNPVGFVDCFINYDEKIRNKGRNNG